VKITILAGGTRGDVGPYTGIGVRLRDAGHDVTFATHQPFADLVRGCGLDFQSIPGDLREVLASVVFQRWQRVSPSAVAQMGRAGRITAMLGHVAGMMREIGDGVVNVVEQGADLLLLSNTLAPLSYHLAEDLGTPSIGVYWGPLEPTGRFPPIMAGYRSLGQWGNRTTSAFALRMMDAVYAGAVRRQRASLGLRPISLRQLRRRQRQRRWPILHGFSPAVVPRPDDWRPGLEVVGYWWPYRSPAWRPPAGLVEFLEAGPPPVFIGFGSMAPDDAEQLGSLAVAALRRAGVRGVIQAGWAGLAASDDEVIGIGDTPHDWLFPRMAAIVHHAGAGTTGAALRAGRPAVPVPVMIDQFFWAARLAALGVAPQPIPFARLSAERLARAIREALDHPDLGQRAAALARKINTEDGAGCVVDAVRRIQRSQDLC